MTKTVEKKAGSRGGAREAMVTIHAFARSRGVTDTAIRKRVKDGTLLPAMAGGKLNVRKANPLLNDATTIGDNIASPLADARKRKLVAKASALSTEVEALRSNVIELDIADKVVNAEQARVRAAIMAIPDQIAFDDDMAGHSNNIFRTIDKKIRDVLTALAGRDDDDDDDEAVSDVPDDQPPELAAMSPSQLATTINNLQADRIEIDALLLSGEAVRKDETADRFDDKLLRVRGRLLAVAGRVASTGDASPSKLKAKLRAALSEALEEFAKEPEPHEPEDDQ